MESTLPPSAPTMTLDIEKILKILPHRYPFLLVDRVTEVTPGQRLLAYKNVTFNEPFFQGHFPGHPVMPGVLIVEAMAQAAGLLAYATTPWKGEEKGVYLTSLDGVRFRRMVIPGDRLDFEVSIVKQKSNFWKFKVSARVEGESAAEAELMAAIADRTPAPAPAPAATNP